MARQRSCARRPGPGWSLLWLLVWAPLAAGQQPYNTQVKRTSTAVVGTDPHAYQTAAEMYRVAPRKELDDAGRQLLTDIAAAVDAGTDAADAAVGAKLSELNAYRSEVPVQQAALRWAQATAQQIGSPSSREAPQLGQADAAYGGGRFAAAVDAYRTILKGNPGHLDARNNLGVALMALDCDLEAQVQFETLAALSERYLPAAVNLTVVYERLGRRAKARDMQARAMALQPNNAQARLNAAWYAEDDNRLREAQRLLQPLPGQSDNPKYSRFLNLVDARLGEATISSDNMAEVGRDIWSNGLGRIYGGPPQSTPWLLAVAVFALGSLLLLRGCAGLGSTNRGSGGTTAVVLFVLFGGAWCLAFWGEPVGPLWLLPAVYVLVGAVVVYRWAESL